MTLRSIPQPRGEVRGAQSLIAHRPLAVLALLVALGSLVPFVHARVGRTLAAQRHLYAGVELATAGRTADAEAEWSRAIQVAPENPNAYRALGALYLSRGDLPSARAVLRRLAEKAPGEEHTLCELAEAELRRGSPSEVRLAADDATLAARLEPDCFRARTVAGNAWVRLGDTVRGLPHLSSALRLNPADVPLMQQMVRILLEDQQLPAATRMARALVRRYPGFAQGHALLAVCYQLHPPASREAGMALPTALEALRLDPVNALAHAQAGHVLLQTDEPRKALPYLESARFLDPRRTATLFDLSRAYQALGKHREARAARAEFRRRSAMETERGTLEKRLAVNPSDATLQKRIEGLNRELGEPHGDTALRTHTPQGSVLPEVIR